MANDYQSLGIIDFDYLEFAVADLEKASELYLRMGFEKAAERELLQRKLKSYLLVQNDIRILVSQSNDPSDPVAQFVASHGDGVIDSAFLCKDAIHTFETLVKRGATAAESPKTVTKDFGTVTFASVKTFGDVRHTLISRSGSLFAEGFDAPLKVHNKGCGLLRIDHLTTNVEKGQMDHWANYYEKIFGLKNTRFFDIHTKRTGLYSKVMQSPDGVIKMPFNEPMDDKSQIQEFIDVLHGPGIQHAALLTNDILDAIPRLINQGIRFLDAPVHTYYEDIPKRVPNVTEPLSVVEDLAIQVDGDEKGYLLQIFTHNAVGPLFYEVIQRKGNDGFGEGNFRALFEAIERDQIKRGYLKA
jgi:4-hydroxyphenylpyruvate dioxygenase